MTDYARSVEHMATVYSLSAPEEPLLRARRKAEFMDWLAEHDAGAAESALRAERAEAERDAYKDALTEARIDRTEFELEAEKAEARVKFLEEYIEYNDLRVPK
jgi:hypothetical protein